MHFINSVRSFLNLHEGPFLLALSGGADSMALFQCLIKLQIPFHAAHIDHRWRDESREEARQLEEMLKGAEIPFHLKVLDPSTLQGNLEAACRRERYKFFKEICSQHGLSGVLTAHHGDDQAETILKRVLEGSHWTHLSGLESETYLDGLRVLRPLIHSSKKEILQFLEQQKIHYFHDKTNDDERYMRARMRKKIFPWLNEAFGKQVQSALLNLGDEVEELKDHLNEISSSFLIRAVREKSGISLNLQESTSLALTKFIIRKLCTDQGFVVSRQIIDQAARALQSGIAHKKFAMGSVELQVERYKIVIGHKLKVIKNIENCKK